MRKIVLFAAGIGAGIVAIASVAAFSAVVIPDNTASAPADNTVAEAPAAPPSPAPAPPAPAPAPPADPNLINNVTLDEYNQIKIDMPLNDVRLLMNANGIVDNEQDADHDLTIEWNNQHTGTESIELDGGMIIRFRNGRVTSKFNTGLK